MSDLCANCGTCHLGSRPTPCRQELVECVICHNLGHMHTFCPKSVHNVDKDYRFFMVCHNCNQWHLPEPCQQDMVQCNRCLHYGHQPYFCPISPLVRDIDMLAVHTNQVHPELLRHLKIDVCKRTLELVGNHTNQQILDFMARPVARPILPPLQTIVPPGMRTGLNSPAQGHLQHNSGHAHTHLAGVSNKPRQVVPYEDPFGGEPLQQIARPQDPPTSPNVPPTPNSAGGQNVGRKASNEQTMKEAMQEKLDRGELAKADGLHNAPGNGMTSKAPPSKNKVTKPKAKTDTAKSKSKIENAKPATKRRAPQPRCDDCKKRHKRCDHGAQVRNLELGSGASQSPQPARTPNADDSEHGTGTPDATDQYAGSVVRLLLPQTGDSNVQNPTITQEQENALRAATAAMPQMANQMAGQHEQLFQGSFSQHGQQSQDGFDQHGHQYQASFNQNNQLYHGNFNQPNWLARSTQHAMSGQNGLDALASAGQSQGPNDNTVQSNTDNSGDTYIPGFRPQHHVLQSPGHNFVHTDQITAMQQQLQAEEQFKSASLNEFMAQDTNSPLGHNHRIVAPNHHSDGDGVFTFNDDGQVVASIEEQTVQEATSHGEAFGDAQQTEGPEKVKQNRKGAGRKRKAAD